MSTPPGWGASPSQGLPVPIYTPGWQEAICKVSCPRTQHNVPSQNFTQTALCTNHEATVPPLVKLRSLQNSGKSSGKYRMLKGWNQKEYYFIQAIE